MIANKDEMMLGKSKMIRRHAGERTPRGPYVYSARRATLQPKRRSAAAPSAVWGGAIKAL